MAFFTSAWRCAALSLALCLCALPAVCQHYSATPGNVVRIQNGVQLTSGDVNVKAQFYAEGIVRVVKWPAGGTGEKSSLSVLPHALPRLDVHVEVGKDEVTLSYGQIKLLLSGSDGAIQYFDSGNRTILKERGRPSFAPTGIEREKAAYSIQQKFRLSADEGVYGLGQQQLGVMNYRGRTVKIVQANTKAVTPMLVSTAGYGIFWDNYSKTIFDDSGGETSFWSEVADNIDYYFLGVFT